MPTQLLSIGYCQTMTPNVVYAMPASRVHLFAMGPDTNGTGANIQFSNDGTVWDTGLATPQSIQSVAAFIRCNTGEVKITLKKD